MKKKSATKSINKKSMYSIKAKHKSKTLILIAEHGIYEGWSFEDVDQEDPTCINAFNDKDIQEFLATLDREPICIWNTHNSIEEANAYLDRMETAIEKGHKMVCPSRPCQQNNEHDHTEMN